MNYCFSFSCQIKFLWNTIWRMPLVHFRMSFNPSADIQLPLDVSSSSSLLHLRKRRRKKDRKVESAPSRTWLRREIKIGTIPLAMKGTRSPKINRFATQVRLMSLMMTKMRAKLIFFSVADTRLYTLPCRSVSRYVGR